ncbi:MAG TPA: ABC transporter permease [Geminicoccus sp.]|uniref:ABC transporter permease n=1 Tax=Geminicoccus sp. TaxID=2024832 RepID=UPI002E331394|nr:ABC transporter permease [Geminicoccus sp.]HEX2528750.1 ABC transporter permease [Geminicoccus sp.]
MSALTLSLRRIRGVFRRHWYLLTASWPRLLDLVYWPTVQVILWGFITRFLATESSLVANAAGIFLSAVLLWDVLFRGQLGVSLGFLEEMYARHFGHLFTSPLRPYEHVIAVFLIALIRVMLGVGGAALLAIPIHGFWIGGALGWSTIAFMAVLMGFGWAIGLMISGTVMRLGMGAESLAWAAIFLIQPISGVFYPIETLPQWLQTIAWCLPTGAVFEGMRAVVVDGRFDTGLFFWALAMLAVWLAIAAGVYTLLFQSVRRRGLLLQSGE